MDENIEVVNSDDSLGLPPEETPSEQPETVAPAESEPTPVVPEEKEELFELPDGRKVDAKTLFKEHTENLLPEFTRRSQELAELKKGNTTEKPADDWQPQSYAELLERASQDAIKAIEQKEQQAQEQQKAIETEVITQLESLKKEDPNLNENALFVHANKYGFRDLSVAYKNMKDMTSIVKTTQEVTAKNIAKRNDAVSITPGATGQRSDPSMFESAADYLRSLKN